MTVLSDPTATLAFNSSEEEQTPHLQDFLVTVNMIHEARRNGQIDDVHELAPIAHDAMDDFINEELEQFTNPVWKRLNIKGVYEYALGNRTIAIKWYLQALQSASSDRQRWTTHMNLANAYRENSEIQNALLQTQEMFNLFPDDIISLIELSQALFEAGLPDEAEEILEPIVNNILDNCADPLVAFIVKHETPLLNLPLKSMQRLKDCLNVGVPV